MAYIEVFKKSAALIDKLGEEKAHIVWVMARYLEEPDLDALAAAALTDGPNDKKIDFIYLDHDAKRLVLTRGTSQQSIVMLPLTTKRRTLIQLWRGSFPVTLS